MTCLTLSVLALLVPPAMAGGALLIDWFMRAPPPGPRGIEIKLTMRVRAGMTPGAWIGEIPEAGVMVEAKSYDAAWRMLWAHLGRRQTRDR